MPVVWYCNALVEFENCHCLVSASREMCKQDNVHVQIAVAIRCHWDCLHVQSVTPHT